MSKRPCNNNCEGCPLPPHQQFTNKHHIEYPNRDYPTDTEQDWRNRPYNTVNIPNCLHQAIHRSGYVPEKPSPEIIDEELRYRGIPARAVAERHRQLRIGQAVLDAERVSSAPTEAA